jgi:hypothetical protein
VQPLPILVGRGEGDLLLLPAMANRHGLIAGATGTGKTITLQVLAEAFSARGVLVFLADVKGDLSGITQPGQRSRPPGRAGWASRIFSSTVVRQFSGMSSVARSSCARDDPKWDRCCSRLLS